LLLELLDQWMLESRDEDIPVTLHRNFLFETLTLCKGTQQLGSGIVLSTVHAVKGMEFDHVLLCGKWSSGKSNRELEEERRVFYTGMTRARHSLSIFIREDLSHPFKSVLNGTPFVHRSEENEDGAAGNLGRIEYRTLSLKEIFLDYAGRKSRGDKVHSRLALLGAGAKLNLTANGQNLELIDENGGTVVALSSAGRDFWSGLLDNILDICVIAMFSRFREDVKEAGYLNRIRIDQWEIPICEVKYRIEER
jgi:ATP-dependent DNA helicase RecQ